MARYVDVEEPRFTRWLFQSTDAAWIWLVVRLYLGYEWLEAGWEKVTGSDQAWKLTFTDASWLKNGESLRGFIEHAALPQAAQGPHSAVNYGWYVAFLRWMDHPGPSDVMAKLISLGEVTVGILLILGLFTGIAAFLAGLLTMAFGLAGVAGVNPVFFLLEILLILAWRNAGYIGLDRWVLPKVGTPWQHDVAVGRSPSQTQSTPLESESRDVP
jgi:thiosulfate dehydrogenase [quinone] large subunit